MAVRQGFEALADGWDETMLEFVHPDFEMVTPPQLAAEPGAYHGHDGVRRWFDSFSEAMDEVKLVPTEVTAVEGSDEVIAGLRMDVRGRTTKLVLSQETVAICTLAESKLIRMRFFPTREEALEAIEPS